MGVSMYKGCVWVRTSGGRRGFVLYPPRKGRAKASFLDTFRTESLPIDDLDNDSRVALREHPVIRLG